MLKSKDNAIAKSFFRENDAVMEYCMKNTHGNTVQKALQDETLRRKVPNMKFLGAPEVLALNKSIIMMKGAKKVLDVGMFTGASALASALAIKKNTPDGKVITCDIFDTHIELARSHWKMAGVEDMIQFEHGPVANTMQKLIDNGESGTFDFVFLDADKPNLIDYYEKILKLLKPGGVIGVDNTLLIGLVLQPADRKTMNDEKYNAVVGTQKLNEYLAQDTDRVHVAQFNIGDGYTLVTKY